jgi:hypothetical protein
MLGSGKLSLKLTFKENKTCQGRRVKISAAAGLAPKAATFFQIDAKKKQTRDLSLCHVCSARSRFTAANS